MHKYFIIANLLVLSMEHGIAQTVFRKIAHEPY
jgi:hypothetical protein